MSRGDRVMLFNLKAFNVSDYRKIIERLVYEGAEVLKRDGATFSIKTNASQVIVADIFKEISFDVKCLPDKKTSLFNIPKRRESEKVLQEKVDAFFEENKERIIENIITSFEEGENSVKLEFPGF